MKDPLISIIIPCYNSAKTIKRCLDSVFASAYSNLEVICINDGSNDNTLEILHAYAKLHSNMITINQDNKRQGYCRNRGIDVASGDYVCFVDSDDEIDTYFICELVRLVQNYDIAICSFTVKNGQKSFPLNDMPNKEITVKEFWSNNFLNPIWSVVPWNKIYKKSVLDDIRFKEDVFFEDEFFANDVFFKDLKINSTSKCLYNYTINSNGTMRTNSVLKKVYLAQARNIRIFWFIDKGWDSFYNNTSRENLYLLLRLSEISKKASHEDLPKIQLCLDN